MAIQIYGNVRNGIQLKYTDGITGSTRTINGANMADKIENTDAVVGTGGYTIAAVYGFGQAIKTLVGATNMETNLIQTRQIADVS